LIAPITGLLIFQSAANGLSSGSSAPPTRFEASRPSSPRSRPAECRVGSRQDHDVDGVVVVGRGQGRTGFALQRDAQCVAGLGPVERHGPHALRGLDQDELGHARP
jgi:hypothetical protein